MVPPTCLVDSKRKNMEKSTMFSENIIILNCCTIIKVREGPDAGRLLWNSPALFLLVIYKEYLNLDLIDPRYSQLTYF